MIRFFAISALLIFPALSQANEPAPVAPIAPIVQINPSIIKGPVPIPGKGSGRPFSCEAALRKLSARSGGKILVGDKLSQIVVLSPTKSGSVTKVFGRSGSSTVGESARSCSISGKTGIEEGILAVLKDTNRSKGIPEDAKTAAPNKPNDASIRRLPEPDLHTLAVDLCSKEFPKVGGALSESRPNGQSLLDVMRKKDPARPQPNTRVPVEAKGQS